MASVLLLPPRRKPFRKTIARGPRRLWPRHRAFIRQHHCVVNGCAAEPIEVSHVRTAANAGTGLKPHDAFAVSMCFQHHWQYHRLGHLTFEGLYGLDLKAIAAEFVRRSPDRVMQKSLGDRPELVLQGDGNGQTQTSMGKDVGAGT